MTAFSLVWFWVFLRWLASDSISLACVGDFSSGSINPIRDGQPSPIHFPQPVNTHQEGMVGTEGKKTSSFRPPFLIKHYPFAANITPGVM